MKRSMKSCDQESSPLTGAEQKTKWSFEKQYFEFKALSVSSIIAIKNIMTKLIVGKEIGGHQMPGAERNNVHT